MSATDNAHSSSRPTAWAALVARHRTTDNARFTAVFVVGQIAFFLFAAAVGLWVVGLSALCMALGVDARNLGIVNGGFLAGVATVPLLAMVLALGTTLVRGGLDGHPAEETFIKELLRTWREVFVEPLRRPSRPMVIGLSLALAGAFVIGIWLGYTDVFGWGAEL